ncbi:hypothetical protein O0I10_004078 [Lichtheimia ornata]|uniref:Uncharacterized protein n=1 Tax=Lichtheimia ornata TaxID=688661 RepID=A0AAD7Y0S9_9FUNG|nr:uncharacterized protein O0I10_004078 [Lichtheimia ornata]KAJ8660218.1 hypothetical protein O0I10_004078 [Lichtheimia ornata]
MRRPTLRLNCLSRLFKKLQRHRTIANFKKPTSSPNAQYMTTTTDDAAVIAPPPQQQHPKTLATTTTAVPVVSIKYDDVNHDAYQQYDQDDDASSVSDYGDDDEDGVAVCGCGRPLDRGWHCPNCRHTCTQCGRSLIIGETCDRCARVQLPATTAIQH